MSNLANNQPISNQNNPFNNYMFPKTIKSTSSIPHQFSQENSSNLNQFSISQQNSQNLNESNLTQTLQLHKLIELENIEEIDNYLKENNLNQNSLNIEIDYILSKYQKGKNIIYSMLSLFLEKGGDINHSITWKNKNKINNDLLYYYFKNSIESKDNITLLMFSIIMNDKNLFDLLIHFNPDINKVDSLNRNAIIYCIIFNDNDNTDILEILINKKANVNSIIKLEMQPNIYEDHSVLTLACFKNLINTVKVLLKDTLLNVNFQTSPNLDTALHIAARFGYDQIAKELLKFNSIYVDIQNKDNKKPIDLAIEYFNNKGGEIYNVFMQYYQNKDNNNNNNNYGMKLNNNNNNNIIFNNNLGNINNIIVNNNNLINENNINNIELRNNLNIENNSPHSSDIGENVEEELKDKIKNGNHKENKNLSKNFINFQNNNNNSNNINKFNIKKLKNKLNLAQSNKTFSSKLNFEIPIELINAPSHINKKDLEYFYLKNNYKKNLNNYMKISNAPSFYFDISDKSIETEIKLDELETILTEKENSIKNFEEKIKDQDNLIKKCKLMLQEREKNLNFYKNCEEEYLKKISELQEEKKNLSNQLPKEKFEKDSKKNKSYKEYREFKFKPAKIDDNYIIHILQKDLLDYQMYVQDQIMKKNSLVEDLLLKVNILINEISYDFEVKLDGSYANNLSLPWSNIDIILINKNPQNRTEMVLLQKLYINMKNKDWIKKYLFEEPIKKMFPVIKILTVDKYSNINIDITFQDDFKYIQMKINLINKFLNENAVLKPLMLALKTILKNANLNNPNSGGLSSYGLILMIVSYIQNQKENNIFSENDEDFLGKIFYGFLQHYGLAFDFGKYVILTYPNNLDNGNNINFGQNNHELIIIDPLDKNNNVAKNTKQFMNLKMAFMIAFMITKEDCECGCHYGRALYEYSLTGTEHCILKRMFNSVKRFSENSN